MKLEVDRHMDIDDIDVIYGDIRERISFTLECNVYLIHTLECVNTHCIHIFYIHIDVIYINIDIIYDDIDTHIDRYIHYI